MPYPNRYRKSYSTYRRKSYSRRRSYPTKRRWKKKTYVSTNRIRPVGVASQVFLKMPYEEFLNRTASSIFRFEQFKSSCYDPDAAIGGHQPRYFDQWNVLYNKYQVLGIKATIKLVNLGPQPMLFGIQWNNFANAPSNMYDFYEARYSQATMVPPLGSNNAITLKSFMKHKTLLGQKSIMQDDSTYAPINADPGNMYYLNVGYQPSDGATGNACAIQVKLKYYVRMFEPTVPAQST